MKTFDDIKFNLNKRLVAPGEVGIYDISDENKVRVVIENAQNGNTVIISGRIKGQSGFDQLKNITGTASEVINVSTYDEIKIDCSVYSSLSDHVKLLTSSFNGAGGSAIESIGVPSGENLTEFDSFSLISSNGTVLITGDNIAKTIDLMVDPQAGAVDSVNGRTGNIILDKSDVGLSNADNTSDLNKPISIATQDALDLKYDASNPAGYITNSDIKVLSVNTYTGDVFLNKSDIGLSNVDNTSDVNKPVSTATQQALDNKQNILGFTPENSTNKSTDTTLGTSDILYPSQNAVKTYIDNSISSVSVPDATTLIKGKIKLAGDLSGTADSPTVPGLSLKYDASNPAGYVTETQAANAAPVQSVNSKIGNVVLTKTDVGLSNVDNTSDLNKPISTATQLVLNGKEDLSNKSIDGTLASNSDILYPSQKAVKTYVDATSGIATSSFDASTYYHELHVNYDFTGATSDGSPYKPFKTIQAAVNAAQLQNVGGNTAILIHLKKDITMVEDIVVNNAVSNLYIMPAVRNNTSSSPFKIIGSLTISGSQTNRVRVQDIEFAPTSGYALIINDTPGRHLFQNCGFVNGSVSGLAGTGVNLINTYRNFIEFVDCTIEGTLNIDGTPVAGTTVTLYRCKLSYANVIVNSPNIAVGMYDTYGIYGITHIAGALAITGMWGFSQTGFLNSTAALSGINFLSLANMSFQKPDLTFVNINKTGTCFYQLINVHRGETSDVLSGTRAVYGPTATDSSYKMAVSGNWSPAVSNVAGALDQLAANKISTSQKGAANGVAPLNASTKIDSTYLPSYVDDVLEFANLASFPNPGSIGIIYVALNTNLIYRWTGSTYVEISPSQALVWGAITGTLSSQTDLQTALDGKANTSHTQALSTLTQSGATTGQVPVWNGTAWAPGVPTGTATWGGISGTLSSQTDLQTALDGKFNNPTGNTTQYIAGDGTLITFPSTGAADRLQTTVYNETGATVPKMSVIYLDGPHGNLPKIVLAIADNETDSALTYGIIQNNIGNMSSGICVEAGRLENLDTNIAGWTEGDVLYLSPTVLGGITNIKPIAPNQMVIVGVLVRKHPSQGVIQVKIQNGYEINELHNVLINGSLAANQTLKYDSVTSLWKNQYIGLASDIEQTSFSGANNQSIASNITGLVFNPAAVRSATVQASVYINASDKLYQEVDMVIINKDTDFFISISGSGDNSRVQFTITNTGQVQYTSGNYSGFVSLTIKFRALTTSV